jgi:hypothetical protein
MTYHVAKPNFLLTGEVGKPNGLSPRFAGSRALWSRGIGQAWVPFLSTRVIAPTQSIREPLNDGKLLPYQLPAVFYPSGTGHPNYAVPTLTIDQAAPAREAAPELLVDERDAGSDITGYAAAAAVTRFEVRRERQTTKLLVHDWDTGKAKGRCDTGFCNERTRRRGQA